MLDAGGLCMLADSFSKLALASVALNVCKVLQLVTQSSFKCFILQPFRWL